METMNTIKLLALGALLASLSACDSAGLATTCTLSMANIQRNGASAADPAKTAYVCHLGERSTRYDKLLYLAIRDDGSSFVGIGSPPPLDGTGAPIGPPTVTPLAYSWSDLACGKAQFQDAAGETHYYLNGYAPLSGGALTRIQLIAYSPSDTQIFDTSDCELDPSPAF